MKETIEYEAPRAVVCGAFFVECVAATVSIYGNVTQADWGNDVTVAPNEADGNGDLWAFF